MSVLKKRMYGEMTSEEKHFDTTMSFSVTVSGAIGSGCQHCLVPQGVDDDQRIGREIVVNELKIRGNLNWQGPANFDTATNVYMEIWCDTQCNGAAASVFDIYTSNQMGTCFENMDNVNRFYSLGRRVFSYVPGTLGAGGIPWYGKQYIDLSVKMQIPLIFNGATGAITELTSNNIFTIWGRDDNTLSTAVVFFEGQSRITFLDS